MRAKLTSRAASSSGGALLLAAVILGACSPDLAPAVPPDFERRPGMDGGPIVVPDPDAASQNPGDAASDLLDAQIFDAGVDDAAEDDAAFADGAIGCGTPACGPGFDCCPTDGLCYPASCLDCCAFLTDASDFFPDAGPLPDIGIFP